MAGIAVAFAILCFGMTVFQLLLAAGLPIGKAAWGGKHIVLPDGFRKASIAAAGFYMFTMTVALSAGTITDLYTNSFENGYLWFTTVFFAIGIPMNAISRSKIERIVSTPLATLLFIFSLLLLRSHS